MKGLLFNENFFLHGNFKPRANPRLILVLVAQEDNLIDFSMQIDY